MKLITESTTGRASGVGEWEGGEGSGIALVECLVPRLFFRSGRSSSSLIRVVRYTVAIKPPANPPPLYESLAAAIERHAAMNYVTDN